MQLTAKLVYYGVGVLNKLLNNVGLVGKVFFKLPSYTFDWGVKITKAQGRKLGS